MDILRTFNDTLSNKNVSIYVNIINSVNICKTWVLDFCNNLQMSISV